MSGAAEVAIRGDTAAAERMTAVARGDAVAFSALVESYVPTLLGAALRILGDRPAAEAAVYAVLLEAWRSARTFAPTHFSVRIWWTIGVRTAALRDLPAHRSTRMASMHDTQITTVDSEAEAVDIGPLRQAIQSSMLDLADEPRSALQLAYFEGLGAEEIAARSQSQADAVRGWLAEALGRLAAGLRGQGSGGAVGEKERLGARYLLGELSPDDAARFDLGEAIGGLTWEDVAGLRDLVHGLALYTFPAPISPQWRARLLATITGPERLSPLSEELSGLLRVSPHEAREVLARFDSPGWRDDGTQIRVLPLDAADEGAELGASDEEVDLAVTMVQRPAWPSRCLVRVSPRATVPSRFPHSEARVLVLQGRVRRSDGEAGAGDLLFWRPGTSLGAAAEGPELLLAVVAGVARAWRG